MADLAKTIAIIFEGDNQVSDSLDKISGGLDKFGSNISSIGEPFAEVTKKVALLDAAIIGLGVAALKASSDIDTETRKMKNSLGLPNEEALRFKEIALEVYQGGFGENLAQAFEVATEAQKRFGDNASVDIKKVSEQALTLQETFGIEYKDALSAAQTLMKDFGLSSNQAFDFISSGFQKGLNSSDDFIDSITEYSTQFSNGGADAGQFFSILETGLQNGVLGTDKAADAFKEFRVRIQDGSDITKKSLESIGIDPAKLQANLQSGTLSVADAFGKIITKINETSDKSTAFQAGVGLIGTQFEDLGQSAVKALDLTKTKIDDLQGATSKLDVSDLGVAFTSLYRTISTEIADASLWEDAKLKLEKIFQDMAASFGPAFENVDFTGLLESVEIIWSRIGDVFRDNDFDLTTVEGMQNAIQMVVDTIETLADVTDGLIEIFAPLVSGAIDLAKWFNSLDGSTKQLIGNIVGLGASLTVIGGIVSAGGALIGGLSTLVSLVGSIVGAFGSATAAVGAAATGFTGIGSAVTAAGAGVGSFGVGATTAAAGATTLSASLASIAGTAGLGAVAGAAGYATGSLLRLIPGVDEAAQGFAKWTDGILNWTGTANKAAEESGDLDIKFKNIQDRLRSMPENTALNLETNADDTERDLEIIRKKLGMMPKSVETDVKLNLDKSEKALEKYSEKPVEIEVWTNADIEKALQSKAAIDKAIGNIKNVEVDASLNEDDLEYRLEKLKTNARSIEAAFEYKAKVDISEIEAATKVTQSAFDSINTGLTSSADVFGSLSGAISGSSTSNAIKLQARLQEESDRRDKEIRLQEKLIEAQVAYYQSKVDAAERGDALIKVDGTGLQPHLEAIMWEVLAAIQVRANEEGQAALLGISV